MADRENSPRFGWRDLEQWADQGLLERRQLQAIREKVADGPSIAVAGHPQSERKKGLNFVTIAYYFGSFMVLLAYTIYMGMEWETLSSLSQTVVSALTIGALWAAGAFLRRSHFPRAGNLLIFAGTGIVPLLLYSIEKATAFWPPDPSYSQFGSQAYRDYYAYISSRWVPMELVSVLVAVLMLWLVRFPLITLLVAFWCWFLSMDLVRWIFLKPQGWNEGEQIASTGIGLLLLILGIYLQKRTREDYSLWFYLAGHVIVFSHLGALALRHEGPIGLAYALLYLGFVVLSVALQRKIFLVFGALGCYTYAGYLAFKVFEGSLGFVYALASTGLIVVLSAVGYQKYLRGHLERWTRHYRRLPGAPERVAEGGD